jgi:ribose-phosphate pyrophosphokinase
VLKERGAVQVQALATHPVFSSTAVVNLVKSELSTVVITDTVPLPGNQGDPKIRVVSVADLLADAIRRIHENRSVSALFD